MKFDPLSIGFFAVALCTLALFGRFLATGEKPDKELLALLLPALGTLGHLLAARNKRDDDDDSEPPAAPPAAPLTGGTPHV